MGEGEENGEGQGEVTASESGAHKVPFPLQKALSSATLSFVFAREARNTHARLTNPRNGTDDYTGTVCQITDFLFLIHLTIIDVFKVNNV